MTHQPTDNIFILRLSTKHTEIKVSSKHRPTRYTYLLCDCIIKVLIFTCHRINLRVTDSIVLLVSPSKMQLNRPTRIPLCTIQVCLYRSSLVILAFKNHLSTNEQTLPRASPTEDDAFTNYVQ